MSNSGYYATGYLQNMILHADNLEDFKTEILPLLQGERATWRVKINNIIIENGYSRESFAKMCGVSRQSVSKWCNGALPSNREDYIRIGFAAHYSLDEMNVFLQRYGHYPALYSKSLEDSVYIYVLSSSDCPCTYAFCVETISAIKERMENLNTSGGSLYETLQLSRELSRVESLSDLVTFIEGNAAEYRTAFAKLYAYIGAFLIANNENCVDGGAYSVNSLANAQGWSSSLRQCVSAIRQKKWFPLRRKVIALGLHLNMTTGQINEMLRLAQMEPLCAKNPIESAIIYAVEDADLNDLICCDGGTELCDHVRNVLKDLGIEDAELMVNDL